ncbi:MAG: hypothetical protein HY686_05915 [Chloroflexi bacterium]|nr:hypothetical protein [Chloroflexota bacterium]
MARPDPRGALAVGGRGVALAALLLLVAVACGGQEEAAPALPPGFLEAGLPPVEVTTYIYASAGERPLGLPSSHFVAGGSAALPGLPRTFGLRSLAAWAGPSTEAFGASAVLQDERTAILADLALSTQKEVWHRQRGDRLLLVQGSGAWAEGLREALEGGKTVSLQEQGAAAWGLLQRLPAAPSAPPVAAGFALLDEAKLRPLLSQVGVSPDDILNALKTARVRQVAFALYAADLQELPQKVDIASLQKVRASAMLVSKAEYPGFIVSTAFGVFASQAGLTKFRLGEVDAYYTSQEGLHLVVRPKGNLIYLAAAPSREDAEALMATVPP